MESQTTSSNKKGYLVIIFSILVIATLVYLIVKNTQAPTMSEPEKVYTQEDLMKIKVLADIAASTTTQTTDKEKMSTLEDLAKKSPQNTTSQDEKLRILKELSAASSN